MTNKLSLSLIVSLSTVGMLAACGGGSHGTAADQKQYETVQEGSAAGVTATIHGPGETLPPITGTNADTTTAFALNPNVAAGQPPQPSGTMASAMPAAGQPMGGQSVGGSPMTAPMTAAPTSAPIPRAAGSPSRPAPRQESDVPPPQQAQPAPPEPQHDLTQPAPPTDTARPAPPRTDTAAPSQPDPNAKPKEEQQPPADDAEQTDEPPPPPTQTDTVGRG